MSIRIILDNPPEFYTNLDFVSGRVVLSLARSESVGNVVVKLEGEARTALSAPGPDDLDDGHHRQYHHHRGAGVLTENHKLLYKVQQVFPDERAVAAAGGSGFSGLAFGPAPTTLNPGQHEFRFRFKVPLNNICYDPKAMSALVGIGGGFGYGNEDASSSPTGPSSSAAGGGGGGLGAGGGGALGAPGFLGLGGFRTMDGTRQLFLQHVKSTLPPSLTGFPREAEVRYYIKVTVQRPGFFKENWRYQVGFKFLPIEPPAGRGGTCGGRPSSSCGGGRIPEYTSTRDSVSGRCLSCGGGGLSPRSPFAQPKIPPPPLLLLPPPLPPPPPQSQLRLSLTSIS